MERTTYLPLEERIRLYSLVGGLRKDGFSYRQIREKIFETTSHELSKATISDWIHGTHHPLGSVNIFNREPSPELAYVIGVVLSDGNLNVHSYHREMLLSVTDQDFAQEFSRCLAKILSRRKYYVVRWSEKRQRWIVQGRSMLLHDFLNRSWEELKPAIEHDEKCTCSFLRAFFDGEGCVSGRTISVSNTDLGLLSYVQQLLRRLDIDTGSIVLGTRSGRKFNDPRTGKTYFTKKDCYSFHIRAHSVETFAARVGFTIERKADRLRKIDPRKVSTLI